MARARRDVQRCRAHPLEVLAARAAAVLTGGVVIGATRAAACPPPALRGRVAHRSALLGRRSRLRAHGTRDSRVRRLVADRPLWLAPTVVLGALVVPRASRRLAADVVVARRRSHLPRRVPPGHAPSGGPLRIDADPDRRRLLRG